MLARTEPRQIVINLVADHPGASMEDLFVKFRAIVDGDPEARRIIDRYYFTHVFLHLRKEPPQRVSRAKVENIKRKLKSVILMNLNLPSGKKLRDATFAECAEAGGWFIAVARHGEPEQIVGKVMTEDELRAL